MTFAVASLLAVIIGAATVGICAPAMTCGVLMMAYRKMRQGTVEVGHVFDGFQRFVPALLFGLIMLIPWLVSWLISNGPAFVVGFAVPDNEGAMILAQLWSYPSSIVLNALIYGATLFALPHIAATNIGPIDALTASYQVFSRNVVMFAVTGFVFQLVSGLGALACCIGLFVTMPLIIAATAQAYADHFGVGDFEAV